MVDKFTCDAIAKILKAKHYEVKENYVEEYELCDIYAYKDGREIYLDIDREDTARVTILDTKTVLTKSFLAMPKTIFEFKLPRDADFDSMILNLIHEELEVLLKYRIPNVTPKKIYEIL